MSLPPQDQIKADKTIQKLYKNNTMAANLFVKVMRPMDDTTIRVLRTQIEDFGVEFDLDRIHDP